MLIDSLLDMKKKCDITTKELSERSGVPVGTINKLFAGQTKDPKLETVKSLVYSMGYTLNDLVEEEQPPEPSADNPGAMNVKYLEEVLQQLGYLGENGDLSENDLHFLMAIGGMLRAWFESRNRQ